MSIEIKISKTRIPYKKAMIFLNKRVEEVKNGDNRELIWILEHNNLYTAGTSYKENEILDKTNLESITSEEIKTLRKRINFIYLGFVILAITNRIS